MTKGLIFDIQRYSLHDGPGIRSTVFLKGCPLKCWWCHNPEGISFAPALILNRQKCLQCCSCMRVCTRGALALEQTGLSLNLQECDFCLKCAGECPVEAIELAGKQVTPTEVFQEVVKDKVFFDQSGGGVTFSGGEPLAQPDFLIAVLELCRNDHIHTAVDTSGYAKWPSLERVAALTDLFLYDLKIMDGALSKRVTGEHNQLILENLHKLAQIHSNIHIRIPVIPTVNDDPGNMDALGRFLQPLKVKEVSLHPYHPYGAHKYVKTGHPYRLPQIEAPSPEKIAWIKRRLNLYGLNVTG